MKPKPPKDQFCGLELAHIGCHKAIQPDTKRKMGQYRVILSSGDKMPCGANEEAHRNCKWRAKK